MSAPLHRRVVGTFFSPGETFEGLKDEPSWAGVLLIGAGVTALATGFIPVEAWEAMLREQLQASGGESPADPASMAAVVRWTGVAGAVVFWFVWALLVAGVTTLLFAFFLGDEGRFRQYFAVVSHALLVLALGAVVTLPLKIAQSDPRVSLSLATFAVGMEEGYLYRLLRFLDLFTIWALVLVALGASRLDPARTWKGATTALLTVFLGMGLLVAIVDFG